MVDEDEDEILPKGIFGLLIDLLSCHDPEHLVAIQVIVITSPCDDEVPQWSALSLVVLESCPAPLSVVIFLEERRPSERDLGKLPSSLVNFGADQLLLFLYLQVSSRGMLVLPMEQR